jgi:regulator of protease activity HflC (stomatin/prohibitin superfamily)
MNEFFFGFFLTVVGIKLGWALLLTFFELVGFYTIIPEGETRVYVLFGNVIGILREPGLYFLFWHLGWRAPLVNWLGQCFKIDVRLDQEYLRSQPVNSEEGAPMGIGIWYEMVIRDPVAFLFKNTEPRQSLAANVRSATVRCLSNMKLEDMLEDRHTMSLAVRKEVTSHSLEWGYQVGSVYIRKVHFRDRQMIAQIEEKVVNRLRQVTSAIKQDGVNQVSIITSTAEKQAAAEFAKAGAVRPAIVGKALQEICRDPEITAALFEILDTQRLMAGQARITLLPPGKPMLSELLAARPGEAVDGAARLVPAEN